MEEEEMKKGEGAAEVLESEVNQEECFACVSDLGAAPMNNSGTVP